GRLEAEQAQYRVALPEPERVRQHRPDQNPRAAQEARLAQVRRDRTERQLPDVTGADAGEGYDGNRLAVRDDRSVRRGAVQRGPRSRVRLPVSRPHPRLQVAAAARGALWSAPRARAMRRAMDVAGAAAMRRSMSRLGVVPPASSRGT